MDKTHKVSPKVAVYKKPEQHTEAHFGLGELLHGRVAVVCTNRGETPQGFISDSIAVVLPLQIPDLENKVHVHFSTGNYLHMKWSPSF